MDIIPLIKLKKRRIVDYPKSFLKEIKDVIDENESLYILDFDGIEKNKPNLCTVQRLASSYDLWFDFGPKDLGDIVDAIMTGAESITLRKPLWPNIKVSEIKEITENKIFTNIDFEYKGKYDFKDIYKEQLDGFVNFYSRKEIESSFQNSDYFKTISKKKNVFTYESNLKNISYWKGHGVKGIIVDFDKYKEFKNGL
jgi:uncharacterized protein related to proFAR isomerase